MKDSILYMKHFVKYEEDSIPLGVLVDKLKEISNELEFTFNGWAKIMTVKGYEIKIISGLIDVKQRTLIDDKGVCYLENTKVFW